MTKPTGNPVGRPKKAAKKSVGRPKGEAGIMKDYRSRMLNSPKSPKVLDSIFAAALDDEHKHQAVAWKLIVDRIVPVAGFEGDSKGAKGGIEIVISGLTATATSIDGECKDITDE